VKNLEFFAAISQFNMNEQVLYLRMHFVYSDGGLKVSVAKKIEYV
jgi:hypothetical protein